MLQRILFNFIFLFGYLNILLLELGDMSKTLILIVFSLLCLTIQGLYSYIAKIQFDLGYILFSPFILVVIALFVYNISFLLTVGIVTIAVCIISLIILSLPYFKKHIKK